MNWLNLLPRPAGLRLPGDLHELLKMSPEEYRRHLRAEGFSDRYIDRELAEIERARERHELPGPAKPAPPPPPPDNGVFEFLLRRRKERKRRNEDPKE